MKQLSVIFCALWLAGGPAFAQVSADHWNGGAVRVGPSATPCEPAVKGLIRYDDAQSVIKFCDGGNWRTVGSTVAGGDNTPDAFSFADLADQPLSTLAYSNIVTIGGIDPDTVVSVTGAGGPEVSVNGGPWGAAGFIAAGDTLRVRQTGAATISTARTAHVTVGTVSVNWNVTTRAGALKIFVTTGQYTGAFGGIAAADAICQNQAVIAGLAGTYKALIADSANAVGAGLNIVYPVVNTAGAVVFSGSMFNQTLEERIRYANGAAAEYPYSAWTGFLAGGSTAGNLCADWTATTGSGRHTAVTASSSPSWPGGGDVSCNAMNRLLCLQQ